MTEGEWTEFLAKHSSASKAADLREFNPCGEPQLKQTEERLEIALPASYRSFLRVSNGLNGASRAVPVLRPVEALRWFGKEHRQWAGAYKSHPRVESFDKDYFNYQTVDVVDFEPDHLKNGLCISEVGDEAVVLLNPMVIWPDGEWEAWLFANWLPGAMRFRSFAEWARFAQAEFLAERFEHRSTGNELPTVYRDPPSKPIRRIRPVPKKYTLPQLLKGLASSDEWTRTKAVKNMRTVRTKEAMNLLINAMKSDPSGYVQWEAAESLGKLGFAEAVDALIEASQDLEQNNSSAIAALARIKDERGHQHLLNLVREGGLHAGVAANQLLERGDRRVIEATQHLLSVVAPAENCLGDLYAEAIAQFGTQEVLDVLGPLIRHQEAQVRMRGVRGIAMLSVSAKEKWLKEKAVMVLRDLLTTETNPEIRRQLEFDLSWVTGNKPLTIARSPFG